MGANLKQIDTATTRPTTFFKQITGKICCGVMLPASDCLLSVNSGEAFPCLCWMFNSSSMFQQSSTQVHMAKDAVSKSSVGRHIAWI